MAETPRSGAENEQRIRSRFRCFMAIPPVREFRRVRNAIARGITAGGLDLARVDQKAMLSPYQREAILSALARSDCIVAEITNAHPNVIFDVGVAHTMGKPIFLVAQGDTEGVRQLPDAIRDSYLISFYENTTEGLRVLSERVASALKRYRIQPSRYSLASRRIVQHPFVVDWDKVSRPDAENLCRELLAQMGYQRLDWFQESRDIDLVAELPKKDPDGYEYRELWLVSMGHNAPLERIIDMAASEPDYLIHRFMRFSDVSDRLTSIGRDVPVTLLFILLEEIPRQGVLFDLDERRSGMRRGGPFQGTIRTRIWDRHYLSSLIQQFPQLAYKYFSDEGRAQSKYRKTPDELNQENVALAERLTTTVRELEEEKNRRVRAERDAVWKDISFSAAHKLGNPIFAIETVLDPLDRRISEGKTREALEVGQRIRESIEKAKDIVDQFKSLTRAQEIRLAPIPLLPVIKASCRTLHDQGVNCAMDAPSDLVVLADPDRLAECFDELVRNALHWLPREQKQISVSVISPAPSPLPPGLDTSKTYALIHFRDNGQGVALGEKTKIFDAFFTTYEHGTGLGLALVRRIIEGHGGTILETGVPGKGADFEIYLQAPEQPPSPSTEIDISINVQPDIRKTGKSIK